MRRRARALRCARGPLTREALRQTDPYGEAFTQQWPVTPYTLRIMNHTGDPVRPYEGP